MSEHDFDQGEWQLGMSLPSRKETHGKKKKRRQAVQEEAKQAKQAGKKKQDKPGKKQGWLGKGKKLSNEQVADLPAGTDRQADSGEQADLSEHGVREGQRGLGERGFLEKEVSREQPEQPTPLAHPTSPSSSATDSGSQPNSSIDTKWQADNLMRAARRGNVVSESATAEPEANQAVAGPETAGKVSESVLADQGDNLVRHAGQGVTVPPMTRADQAGHDTEQEFSVPAITATAGLPVQDTTSVESDRMAAHAETAATTVAGFSATALDHAALPVQDETEEDEDAQDELELPPLIGKWQRRFLIAITPILILAILIYGKIGYVHHIPDLVRKNVPAYAEGQGFLIVKPWWFGPPVIDLDQIGDPQAESFELYRASLNNYEGVLDKPFVLKTYPQDILNQ